MVPNVCKYKWHSNGLKAHILGEVCYYPCSKYGVFHLEHTVLNTVVISVKMSKVAAKKSCHLRTPFLERSLRLPAWFTQIYHVWISGHAQWRFRYGVGLLAAARQQANLLLSRPIDTNVYHR